MGEHQTIDLNQAQYITDIEGHLEPSLDLNELARRGIVDAGSAGRTHPLAPEERALISTKGACIAGHLALTGYSVLIGSQKYLVPTIQIVNPESLRDPGRSSPEGRTRPSIRGCKANSIQNRWFSRISVRIMFWLRSRRMDRDFHPNGIRNRKCC